ncbi:MAG: hypothetical protein HY082_10585 [Gammaproteobacteria bacterium]|nr:hypothetical protein [Gammaproteobacteria bacterium]
MRAAKLPARAALDWIVCGVGRVRRERERWIGAALVYLIIAVVLHRVPFLGDLVLILLSPFLLGSLLQVAAEQEPMPPPVALKRRYWRALIRVYLLQPLRGFGRLFRDEERLLPALMLSILALGGVVLAQIVAYLLIGGSPVGGLNAASVAVAGRGVWLPLLMTMVLLLYLLLTMALFYSVPLTVLDGRTPPTALFRSFRGCKRNALPLSLFTLVFFLPYAVIVGAFNLSRWLGYPILFLLGTATLAVFLAAAHCSFQALYRRLPVVIETTPGDHAINPP